ncbi:NAD(P)H dehydrogenase (quinone) [Mucilaginibacter oryzae]|uniref:NAD(P)H dehydrogenase (Quinone) n=1 Tax=Mucilaginibacter oryzae TaxID=468058 RepID=A0A316HQV9_9SPHI|nr:SDR family oxidoreductase [Mucilaginibacter oryzae]PWK77262.1 NAD(P)H dehydrogenase (quinone) [Mucilaginibacter oryzae]
MILITGATGHLGGAVAEQLLKHLSPGEFAILARDAKKSKHFAERGIEVRLGDFDDQASLDQALKGISKVLLIPTIVPHRLEQNKRVVDTAVKQGVKHVVYTGISHKDIENSAVEGLDAHFQTEDYIKQSGLAYTFLRNSLYMDILPFYGGEKVLDMGFYLPAGDGKVPFALRREMGEAAANVFLQQGHENKTYEIAGSELYSYADVAATLSGLTGKKVGYTAADPDDFKRQLKDAGVDDFISFVITGFNIDVKNGFFETITHDLEQLLGRKPANLERGIAEVFGFN